MKTTICIQWTKWEDPYYHNLLKFMYGKYKEVRRGAEGVYIQVVL